MAARRARPTPAELTQNLLRMQRAWVENGLAGSDVCLTRDRAAGWYETTVSGAGYWGTPAIGREFLPGAGDEPEDVEGIARWLLEVAAKEARSDGA